MKRGQLNQALLIMIAAVVIVAVFVMGFWGMQRIADAQCQAELIKFKADFRTAASSVGSNSGKTIEKSFLIPCGYDRLYFADYTKDVTFNALENIPMVVDSLRSGQERNIFFIKNGRVDDSEYIDGLDLALPYYLCVSVENTNAKLIFENIGGRTLVRQQEIKADCSFESPTPVELSVDDMASILFQIYKVNNTILDYELVDPIATGITRDIIYSGDITIFNITKMNGSFDYYVMFPSCMIPSLNKSEYYGWTDMSSWSPHENISDSPAIVKFHFNDADDESIQYSINDTIDPGCIRGGLLAIGIDEDIYPDISDPGPIIQLRKETNSPTMDLARSKTAIEIERMAITGLEDVSQDLNGMKADVRFSGISQKDKINVLGAIDSLVDSLKDSPGEAPVRYENLRQVANRTGFGEDIVLKVNDSLLKLAQANHFAKYLIAKSYYKSFNAFEFNNTNDKNYSDICYDGSVNRDICINSTHIREVKVDGGICKYDSPLDCDPGQICVSDRCVSASGGICGDNDEGLTPEFKVVAIGERNTTGRSSNLSVNYINAFDCNASGSFYPNGFVAGDSIEFRIETDTGKIFYSNKSRNPLNQKRAVFEDLGDNLWIVGFEDGNDTSYDDCVFMVRGGINTSTGLKVASSQELKYFKSGNVYHLNQTYPDFCRRDELADMGCNPPRTPNETQVDCTDYGLVCRGGACRMPLPKCTIETIDGVKVCLEDGVRMKTQTCVERDQEVLVQDVYCDDSRCRRTPPSFVGYTVRCRCTASSDETGGYVC